MEKAIEGLVKLGTQNGHIAELLTQGLLNQNQAILANQQDAMATIRLAVEKLGDVARPAAREMVTPIGSSCTGTTHAISGRKELSVTFDIPMAEALREEGTSVGTAETHIARVSAVDKTNGHCKFEIDGMERPVRATIADPALKTAGNLYTHALDTNEPLVITVKPMLDRHGEVREVFIMDAKRR